MATISSSIELVDRMTPTLTHIVNAVNMTISAMYDMRDTMNSEVDTAAFESIRDEIAQAGANVKTLENNFDNVSSSIQKADSNTQQLDSSVQSAAGSINTANAHSISLVKTLAGLSVVKSILNTITGQLDSAISRMDTMTNFTRTMTAITGSADAADASLAALKDITTGTAYGLDTAAAAVQNFTTRGLGIGAATSEVGKWADAVAFYGDGTNETLTTVTDALGKMLSKGTVEMQQLNRLTDEGINAVGIYAEATGQSSAAVQSDLSAGIISAQDFITTVSTAFEEGTNGVLNISGAAKEAGATWETTISNAKAAITRGLVTMIDNINTALSNSGFNTILGDIQNFGSTAETVLGNLGTKIGNLITVLSPVLNLVKNIADFIGNNWTSIAPIIGGIVTAVGLYNAALGIQKIKIVAAGLASIMKAGSDEAAALAAKNVAASTGIATAAQWSWNAAILASPITWIVLAVIALIVVIIAVIAKIAKTSDVVHKAFSVICGWISVAGAFFKNLGLEVASIAVGIWEALKVCWDNVGAAFDTVKYGIQSGFYSILSTVLTVISSICEALNKLPFIEFDFSGIEQKASEYASKAAEAAGSIDKGFTSSVAEAFQSGYDSIGGGFADGWSTDAFNKGVEWGNEKFGSNDDDTDNLYVYDDYTSLLSQYDDIEDIEDSADTTAANTGSTADSTASIADSLSVTDEELKYLRDIAEQETVNRFTTAQITIEQTNNNNVAGDMDLDGVIDGLISGVNEAAAVIAEGVHI